MIPPTDCYLTVDSLCTRYWQVGTAGSPVILIHGIGGSVENFLPALEPLAARHRVYALDLPGHGLTDKPAALPDFDRFVDHFMQHLEIRRAHIVGHAMGGWVALSLTLQFPERVDHLVLMDSTGLGRELSLNFRLPVLPVVGDRLARGLPGTQQAAQQAVMQVLRRSVDISGQKARLIDRIRRGLPSIHSPVLIIWGREDEVVPVKHAEKAAQLIPGARLHILENCKHLPMIEKTQEVNALLVEFLHE